MAKIEIGNHFYSWYEGEYAESCMVSCHAASLPFSGFFRVPENMELHFFCEDGGSINADRATYNGIAFGLMSPVEVIKSGGLCRNYQLRKFQGYHASSVVASLGILAKPWLACSHQEYHESYDEIERNLRYAKKIYAEKEDITVPDVVTVRYRFGRIGPSLKDLVEQIAQSDLPYQKVFCCFCRYHFSEL